MAASPLQQASLWCWELIGRERALIKKRCEASPACWLWPDPVNSTGPPELFTEPITLEVQILHSNASGAFDSVIDFGVDDTRSIESVCVAACLRHPHQRDARAASEYRSAWSDSSASADNALLAAHLIERCLRVNLVVPDVGLHFNQIAGVEIVVLRQVVVVPGETLDGVRVFPERQHLEMRYVRFCAVQTPRATISARCQIVRKRNPPHEVQVFISLRNGNHPVPYASDHLFLSSSST